MRNYQKCALHPRRHDGSNTPSHIPSATLSTAAGAALQSDKRDDEAAAGNPADTYVTAAQGWAVSPTFTNLAGH